MAASAYHYPADLLSEEERERLILEHIPQVRLIARKIQERVPDSVCFDDLMSAGVVGLIQAIDNFDPRQNTKLRTYAEFRIRGAILDSLRQSDWAPRLKRKQAREFETAIGHAEQRLGRTPEEAEIAAELLLTVDQYREKLTEMEALNIAELEFVRDDGDTSAVLRYTASPEEAAPDVTLERAELERLIAGSIDRIPKVEKTVLSLYFYEELTLREIAQIMGIHLSRVSQIKSQAILRLRTAMVKNWPGVRV
ncbi:MAG TPA: FliA/WhiG family RNA polymerase sigma factor [Bryobacteraceae bacterium]|nr:FliA/WhiG family RNA polymerase sigma factor [Bryobacteraceae bacterium]